MLALALEWSAFTGAVLSVWFYGRQRLSGPVCGCVTALLFIVFGAVAGLYAAIAANLFFLALHTRNGYLAMLNDTERQDRRISDAFALIQAAAHGASTAAGWWTDLDTGKPKEVDALVPEKLCLIHSEISEAMEGHRKRLMDDKLPHRKAIEVELADAVIRIADLGGALRLDVGGAIAEKMRFNAVRPDHKIENRLKAGGKAY